MEELIWIERIKIEDFGCVKQVELSLSRLHALIGPNDSGKSTILRAIQSSQPDPGERLLLIEKPENGLHPSRIREMMRALRAISEYRQIVLKTHSPLVINELQPEEVTIVTRTLERGTICTPMTQTKNFKERSEVYALGELWLSYADGDLEKELVGDDTETAKE